MTDKQFTALMQKLAKAGNKFLKFQEQAEDEYERRYGANPSDIDDDLWIDALTTTSGGLTEGITAKMVDEWRIGYVDGPVKEVCK